MKIHFSFCPTVNILLSTYNGDRFLGELLDSLFAQDYPKIVIHIRDDGSSDNTPKILSDYSQRYSNMFIQYGENIGVVASFMTLLRNLTDGGALYSFCDQDDIWLPNKISRAVDSLSRVNDPASTLYCSRLEFVDVKGSPLGLSRIPRVIGFRNAVVENIAVGCTIVFGDAIRCKLLQTTPEKILMHDWWAYLTASAFGEVVYDRSATVYYRRHDSNATTLQNKNIHNLLERAQGWVDFVFNDRRFQAIEQAEHFAAVYHELSLDKRRLIERLTFLRKCPFLFRLMLLLTLSIERNDPVENLGIRIIILLGRF
jgi:glycosyltransferase involved in cell wall biosynthesis